MRGASLGAPPIGPYRPAPEFEREWLILSIYMSFLYVENLVWRYSRLGQVTMRLVDLYLYSLSKLFERSKMPTNSRVFYLRKWDYRCFAAGSIAETSKFG